MKIGVCIRAKNESNIICDFVNYYINIGFDKIIIYDNLSIPSIKDILAVNNIKNDKIQLLIDSNPVFNQTNIYLECINNNKDLDWLLLCDADEFIYCNGNIKLFLEQFSEDTSTILINWLVFGTSNINNYDITKPVFSQFTYREDYTHFWNRFVKSFIRPKLIEHVGNVHITINPQYKIKNVYNQEYILDVSKLKCDVIDPKLSINTPVVIIHYMTLDFESMSHKHDRNISGKLLLPHDKKYSLEWYNSKLYGFLDNNIDTRMVEFNLQFEI